MDTENEKNDDVTIEPELDTDRGGRDASDTVKKLKADLKVALEERQKYLDNWQRDKAEFLNARKRDKESQDQMIKFANENLVAELLPVLESFEMAFANKEAWEKVDTNWRMGVEYIANQLKTVLENTGLKEVNPAGQRFDPMRDEAVGHDPVEKEALDHTITAVVQKGYEFNGRQLKAPKVRVGEYKK